MKKSVRKCQQDPRKTYEKPEVRSEKLFETNALACGKCPSGPVGQYQCGMMLMNS